MRDTFLDIQSSRPFNGDPPYIFRFEEGQSIGLNYIKKICMVSDSPTATIRTEPDQNIFRVLRMTQSVPNDMETVKMNLKVYADLDKLIAPDNRWGYGDDPEEPACEGTQYVLARDINIGDPPGEPTDWVYIYMFYILGRSEEPGEYLGKFWINDIEYRISADFYSENEVLKENLKNFESKLPESIQKAIYENNVHEELNDNILINRKNKELLMNYMSILGNKGSYNSLLNSINWFEWGDLLRLEEFWKRYINDDLDYDYFASELNRQLTPEDVNQLANNIKSTFIGLYCTLNRLQKVRGRVAYQDSFGRSNIQPMTSWQDQDASHMYAPEDMYHLYVDGDHVLEPAIIAPVNSIPGELWDDLEPEDLDPDNLGEGEAAVIGTEEVMSYDDFINYHPGTMSPGSNTPGNWARVEYPDGNVEWIEIAPSTSLPSGGDITFWDIDFNYIYNEQMPNLLKTFAMWSSQDLSLKMTVLGNFFSSFFMPIHLDLIHSCIEYWAYSYALKLIYSQSEDLNGCVINTNSFDMVWESDLKIAPHPETRTYKNTLFKNYNTEKVFGFSTDIADHPMDNAGGEDIEQYNWDVMRYFYAGACCPVRFIGKIYAKSDDPNMSIYRQKLIWILNGGSEEFLKDEISSYHECHYFRDPDTGEYFEIYESIADRLMSYDPDTYDPEDPNGIPNDGFTYSKNFGKIDTNVCLVPDIEYVKDSIPVYWDGHFYKDTATGEFVAITDSNKWDLELSGSGTYSEMCVFNLDFKIGFKEAGDYDLRMEFYATNSRVFDKTFRIGISDFMHNEVEIMKLVPAEYEDWGSVAAPIELYQYANTRELSERFKDSDILLQSHFFAANASGDPEKAGLNHTLIGIVEKDYEFDGDTDFDPDSDITSWYKKSGEIVSGPRTESPFEGSVISWERDGRQAVWSPNDDPEKWPAEWGEYTEGKSIEYDGRNIPDTYIDNGRINNLIRDLEERFPEYWWSWDRIQISKRWGVDVKAYPFNPYPKGNNITMQYPDEYPVPTNN